MSFKAEFSVSGLGTPFAHGHIFTELKRGAMVVVTFISLLVICLCGKQHYVAMHHGLT